MAEKFSGGPPASKESTLNQEAEAQAREKQALEKREKRAAFASKFLTRDGFPAPVRKSLEQLSNPELMFMRGFIDAHAGEWDLYDMRGVRVTNAQVDPAFLTVTFCILGETDEDDMFLDQRIPRIPEAEEELLTSGHIKPRSLSPRC